MQFSISRTVACALILVCAGILAVAASAAPSQPRHHRSERHRPLVRQHRMTPHQRVPRHPRVQPLPADYGAWSRVASCESGGWQVLGYAYPDSLGIDRANWLAFGGTPLPPGGVSRAAESAEIRVADRLTAHYHVAIPDQYGCAAW
ncbi:MAG: hypothetical protein ACRDL5_12460 [Solirubrobacteraceae bacterium]